MHGYFTVIKILWSSLLLPLGLRIKKAGLVTV